MKTPNQPARADSLIARLRNEGCRNGGQGSYAWKARELCKEAADYLASIATPSPVTDETLTDEVQRLIAIAYAAGCQAVHDNYQEDRDPDFSEAASDYARSIDLAALASTPQPASAETLRGLTTALGIIEADLVQAQEEGDEDWIVLSQRALSAVEAAIRQSAKGGK